MYENSIQSIRALFVDFVSIKRLLLLFVFDLAIVRVRLLERASNGPISRVELYLPTEQHIIL